MDNTQGNNVPGVTINSKENQLPIGESNEHCNHRGRHGCRGGRFLFIIFVALAAGTAGGYIGKSYAQGRHFMAMSGDPAKMDERVDRMVKRFASKVDATPEQQQKLATIAKGASRDMAPVRDKLRDARKQAIEIARAPTVDRAALEKLRVEQLQLADSVSKRMTQALADAAEVLTPEQRHKITGRLAERMEHREHGWGWQRG